MFHKINNGIEVELYDLKEMRESLDKKIKCIKNIKEQLTRISIEKGRANEILQLMDEFEANKSATQFEQLKEARQYLIKSYFILQDAIQNIAGFNIRSFFFKDYSEQQSTIKAKYEDLKTSIEQAFSEDELKTSINQFEKAISKMFYTTM